MNRNEFMTKLELLLADISSEEREEALQYYNDYFEDAGVEKEMDVIRELGSPEKIAATIKADMKYGSDADAGTFTEQGYRDERFEQRETPVAREVEHEKQNADSSYQYAGNTATGQNTSESPKTSTGLKIALVILIVLVGALIIIPVGIGLAFLVFGLLIAVFAFFAGLVVGAVAIMFAGAVLIGTGIALLTTQIPAAFLTMGTGFLTFVVGLIGTVATGKLCIVMYPAICRILVNICRKPFHKGKAVA